jgi:hypothetical protein
MLKHAISFLFVAASFSAAVKMGQFGAGMQWQLLEPIQVGLLAMLEDAHILVPNLGWVRVIILT